jgi:hypothetical protein
MRATDTERRAIEADATPHAPALPGGRATPIDNLITAFEAIPGCLGVETAATRSGKRFLFAWFEDRDALMRWYSRNTCPQRVWECLPEHRPVGLLQYLPDEGSPIMAVVSIAPAEERVSGDSPASVSRFEIVLYQPFADGLFLDGRFSPV